MHTSTSLLPTFTPNITFNLLACLIIPARTSATIIKRKGARGSLFLIPLVGLNSSVGLSLTKTDIEVDVRHAKIQSGKK